jgi:hypothetical protein
MHVGGKPLRIGKFGASVLASLPVIPGAGFRVLARLAAQNPDGAQHDNYGLQIALAWRVSPLRPPGIPGSNGVHDFGDGFIPACQENAGYVPTRFIVQHDEINSSFDPTEQLLAGMTIKFCINEHPARSGIPPEGNWLGFRLH